VIECARSIYFRNDWDEATRFGAVELFEQVMDDGLIIRAAQAAAANIPADGATF